MQKSQFTDEQIVAILQQAEKSDKPHTGKKSAVTPEILSTVRQWLTTDGRTWNARQIAAEVGTRYGVARSIPQWRRLLHREQMTYKRTRRSLRHKQDPAQVAAGRAELGRLKGGPTPGS